MNARKRNNISDFINGEYSNFLNYTRRRWSETSESSSEDILQDVFTNIFNKSDISIPLENLASYIYRSISNRIIDLLRRKSSTHVSLDGNSQEEEMPSLLDIWEDERFQPENEAEARELREYINRSLDRLKPAERTLIYETEFKGVPYRVLSQLWDVPIGTLLSRKKRALYKLKLDLQDYYLGGME